MKEALLDAFNINYEWKKCYCCKRSLL